MRKRLDKSALVPEVEKVLGSRSGFTEGAFVWNEESRVGADGRKKGGRRRRREQGRKRRSQENERKQRKKVRWNLHTRKIVNLLKKRKTLFSGYFIGDLIFFHLCPKTYFFNPFSI